MLVPFDVLVFDKQIYSIALNCQLREKTQMSLPHLGVSFKTVGWLNEFK